MKDSWHRVRSAVAVAKPERIQEREEGSTPDATWSAACDDGLLTTNLTIFGVCRNAGLFENRATVWSSSPLLLIMNS